MSNRASRPLVYLASIMAMLFIVALGAVPDADAKKGKIRACVAKKGPDKGTMRWAHAGKCHKGEKSVKWNKRGRAGKPGQPGAQGPAGPAGEGANQDAVDALRAQLESQAVRLSELEGRLGALSTDFAAFQTAACAQLTTLTNQSNALASALGSIALGGTIPPLLTLVTPTVGALPAYSC